MHNAAREPAAAAIKKGSPVWFMRSWDGRGTFFIEHFIVGSWGKVQGHLIRGNGACAERRVYTQRVNNAPRGAWIFVDTPDFDPRAKALELAAAYLVAERAHFDERIQRWPHDAAFVRCMETEKAALHEPRLHLDAQS